MKRLIWLVLVLCGSALVDVPAEAQERRSSEIITVKADDLPAELFAKLKEKQHVEAMADRVKQYGEWVGIGKEVGVAVNEGLTAVTEQASKFSETTPGKVTIAVIVWKVVGKDILGILIGVPLLIFATYVYLFVWRTLFRGKFIFAGYEVTTGKKKYEFKPCALELANSKDDQAGVYVMGGVATVVYFIGSCIVVNVIL